MTIIMKSLCNLIIYFRCTRNVTSYLIHSFDSQFSSPISVKSYTKWFPIHYIFLIQHVVKLPQYLTGKHNSGLYEV